MQFNDESKSGSEKTCFSIPNSKGESVTKLILCACENDNPKKVRKTIKNSLEDFLMYLGVNIILKHNFFNRNKQ
ncbi:MAG: hypothetical protein H6611_04025 [Ignavibacteriales bacterium]|nr:hypothetical protein [Ignavibacteriales bacterium]